MQFELLPTSLLLSIMMMHYHPSDSNHAYFDGHAASIFDEFIEGGVDSTEFYLVLDSEEQSNTLMSSMPNPKVRMHRHLCTPHSLTEYFDTEQFMN